MYAKKNSGKKVIVLLLAVVMLIGCAVGGTVAYLMTHTDPVENTFVAGNIGTLTLVESDTDENTDGIQREYVIIPGKNIVKDPKVTYTAAATNDVGDVYVFVEVSGGTWTYDSSTNTFAADSLSWEVTDAWKYLSGKVFYQKVSSLSEAAIIKGNTIVVGSDIQKGDDMTAAVEAADGLSFTAYAIQAEGFADDADTATGQTAAQKAWAAVGAASTPADPAE